MAGNRFAGSLRLRGMNRFPGDRYGLIRRQDALAVDISDDTIRSAVRAGDLVRLAQGVFVEPSERFDGPAGADRLFRLTSIAVATTQRSSGFPLSHASAAALHGLALLRPDRRRVHLTSGLGSGGNTGADRHVHPTPLGEEDMTVVDGVRVTSLARTAVDVASATRTRSDLVMRVNSGRAGPVEPAGAESARGRLGEHAYTGGMTTADRRTEVRALSELGLTEIGKASAGIHHTHRAISDRVFGAVRWGVGAPTVLPVKTIHDALTDGVYRIVGQVMTTAGKVGGVAADLPLKQAPSTTRLGATIIAAVNGVIGDELDAHQSPLAQPVSIRVDGAPVPLTTSGLTAAYPGAQRRIVVAVHGLAESEHMWAFGKSEPYADQLARVGVTTVFLRYNTGRRISTNGKDVAELLDELVRRWPVPIESVSLLGHSMGGLVARSAAHYGRQAGHNWVHRVRTSVSLGTPHLGAPLENLAHIGSAGLMTLPETPAFARPPRRPSGGTRDPRVGSILDEEWTGRDADDLARVVATEAPLLPGVEHYYVSATLADNPRSPLSRIIGDGLVLHHSASGHNSIRRIGFNPDNGLHVGRTNHLTLLNDPRVAEKLIG